MRDSKTLARLAAAAFLGAALIAGPTVVAAQEVAAPDPAKAAESPNLEIDDLRGLFSMRGGDRTEEKDFEPLAKVTDGMEKIDGFITLYVDKKKDKIYGLIPGRLVGKDFLLSTSMSRGARQGFQWSDMLMRVERSNRRALMVMPNTFYTAEGKMKELVDNTYTDPVLTTARILAEGSQGAILVDLKEIFAENASAFVGMRPPAMVTEISSAKSFPANTILEFNFRSASGSTGVYYSFNELPGDGYKPREADQRVGYFLTARKNFSKDERADDTFERYINRWNLKKADPSLKLSPPVEPIVFYIEDTVPVKFRDAVRKGIEVWNRAFEKVGISNAIVVRQQTDSQFTDLDPEDARYNFIRWIASESAFAMGPSRTDPRTGQIFDADIIVDESMVRSYLRSYDLYVSTVSVLRDLSPQTKMMLAQNPSLYPDWERARVELALRAEGDDTKAGKAPEQLWRDMLIGGDEAHRDHRFCSIGQELSNEMAFLELSMGYWARKQDAEEKDSEVEEDAEETEESSDGAFKVKYESSEEGDGDGSNGDSPRREPREEKTNFDEWPEDFIAELLEEVVAHEVGHTLGLRHNFKASSWKSYSEIVNETDDNVATIGSVMDYNPINLFADGKKPEQWITRTIGPYDYFAIEYGYAIPGSNGYPKGEDKTLAKILEKASLPEHVYATDEDVNSPDPYVNRFDLGSDPLEYHIARQELAGKILDNLLDVVMDDDEGYWKARRAFSALMGTRFSTASLAAKHIGGHSIFRDVKGNNADRDPINVVSADVQRRALQVIVDSVLKEGAFKIDPKVQRYLAASRWSHQGSRDWSAPLTYPIQDDVLSMQRSILFSLMTPDRIKSLYDAEFRVDAETDLLTLPEFFSTLTNAIFAEVIEGRTGEFTARQPMIDNLRRNLQREYIGRLITVATSGEASFYPAISRTLAWQEMKTLHGVLGGAVANRGGLDPYTVAHLDESHSRIGQALQAQYTIGGASGSGGMFFLFGQEAATPSTAVRTTGDLIDSQSGH